MNMQTKYRTFGGGAPDGLAGFRTGRRYLVRCTRREDGRSLSSGGRSSERARAFSYLSGTRHPLVMLLSEMTFNAVPVPWHVLAGWVLLALALWVGEITVVRRRGWLVKVGGGLLLASATVVSILVAVLLVIAPPKLPTRQGIVVEAPARRKLDQP
jgi:hypothetical protein